MRLAATAATVLSAALLSACVVYPRNGYYRGYDAPPADTGVVVDAAPPPPQYEVLPAAPFLGAVWLAGWWGWGGGRWHWNGGHWSAPRQGYRWQPHAWVPNGGRWHLRGGGWVRH